MQDDIAVTKLASEDALAALRARLDKARLGADRAAAGGSSGLDSEALRQVYASHIAWLEDRISEMEGWRKDEA